MARAERELVYASCLTLRMQHCIVEDNLDLLTSHRLLFAGEPDVTRTVKRHKAHSGQLSIGKKVTSSQKDL